MRLRFAVLLASFAFAFSSLPAFSQLSNIVATPSPTVETPALPTSSVRMYHDHSIRDIDAIGNRNIGCARGFGNWYSLERQISIGKQYSDEVEMTSRLVSDHEITEYVNRIGQNLVRNSDSLVPFTIKVIESDDINAFALPGGFF